MANRIIRKVARVAQRFLSALFENLPPEYGNLEQPDLRVFEAWARTSQRQARQGLATVALPYRRSRSARRDEFLERL